MTFWKYLRRICENCHKKVPKGTGMVGYAFFERICDRCWIKIIGENRGEFNTPV